MSRHEDEARAVRELAAKLRAEAPALFAKAPSSVPPPTPQPAKRPPNLRPEFAPMSSVMRPIAERVERERAARLEAEWRAADPIERQADRLAALAPMLTRDQISDVGEVLQLARDERAGGDLFLSDGLLEEVVEYLDNVGRQRSASSR